MADSNVAGPLGFPKRPPPVQPPWKAPPPRGPRSSTANLSAPEAAAAVPVAAPPAKAPSFLQEALPEVPAWVQERYQQPLPPASSSASSSTSWPAVGQRLPPASAYDDPSIMQMHRYRETADPGGRTLLNFNPERFVSMLFGRPVGLIILSHDFSPPYEHEAYLAKKLAPLRPVYTMGPTERTKDVRGHAGHSIYHQWKEAVLPFIANDRHAEDTLWLVAEADFCFDQADADIKQMYLGPAHFESVWKDRIGAMSEGMTEQSKNEFFQFVKSYWLEASASKTPLDQLPRWRAWGIANAESVGSEAVSISDPRWLEEYWAWENRDEVGSNVTSKVYVRRTNDDPNSSSKMTEELTDLLTIANQAARIGRGSFVWLSWNAFHWNSKSGARTILAWMNQRSGPAHTGTWMRELLHDLQDHPDFGACYIQPPIGHYFEHECSWADGSPVLTSKWGKAWVQGGTRPKTEHDVQRCFCRWTASGPADRLQEIPLPAPEFAVWWTESPPDLRRCWTGLQYWHLGEEEFFTAEQEEEIQKLMRQYGIPRRQIIRNRAWISSGSHTADDEEELMKGPDGRPSKRRKRNMRMHRARYNLRVFAADPPFDAPWVQSQVLHDEFLKHYPITGIISPAFDSPSVAGALPKALVLAQPISTTSKARGIMQRSVGKASSAP
eukprot:TRINITY_DN2069_c0_g1_i5.p1 TRINITY_DN2069_c0_g1~~TRINITY_DN2069_c0_g1_i5.p1  ORF type:complete len:666 (+),score=78.68 TRINITY_DN2069_c0_g1_i5:83-2080(+)